MSISDESATSISLIVRVGRSPTDEVAWAEFVGRYGPKIVDWARGWGLQQADADDVAQAVLVKLARQMGRFTYDPSRSFRGWLRTLARNAWLDWTTRPEARERAEGGSGGGEALATIEAREDLIRRLSETFDLEVLIEAVHRTRGRVADRTWEAYRLLVQDDRPAREVADRLGMTVASAFKAKSNVLKLIREEVAVLEAEPEGPMAADPSAGALR